MSSERNILRKLLLCIDWFPDTIWKEMDNGKLTGAVFVDLSKAFDTISHSELLEKLQAYGIERMNTSGFVATCSTERISSVMVKPFRTEHQSPVESPKAQSWGPCCSSSLSTTWVIKCNMYRQLCMQVTQFYSFRTKRSRKSNVA